MAFDAHKYKGLNTSEKALPIVLLLDVSGSMEGDKIDTLNRATNLMVDEFARLAKTQECGFKIAIITFGNNVELHTPYTDVKSLKGQIAPLEADGMTPLGHALSLAKDMIDDKNTTKGRWYRPVVVLVSDGWPNDEYEDIMRAFIETGRTAKCQRFSVGIGQSQDLDENMLRSFVSVPENYLHAEQAPDIVKAFQFITMSTTQRTASANPNVFAGSPASNKDGRKPAAIVEDDDDEEFT